MAVQKTAHKMKLEKRISANRDQAIMTQLAWIKWIGFFLYDRKKLAESIGARHEPATEQDPPIGRAETFRMLDATMDTEAKELLLLIKETGGLSLEAGIEAESYFAKSETTPAAGIKPTTSSKKCTGRITDLDQLEVNDLVHTGNDAASTPELEALWRNYVGSSPEIPHGWLLLSSARNALRTI